MKLSAKLVTEHAAITHRLRQKFAALQHRVEAANAAIEAARQADSELGDALAEADKWVEEAVSEAEDKLGAEDISEKEEKRVSAWTDEIAACRPDDLSLNDDIEDYEITIEGDEESIDEFGKIPLES